MCKSVNILPCINQRKGKDNVVIFIDAEKAFDKIKNPIYDQNSTKLE